MSDERISDERLRELVAWMRTMDWTECHQALRELQAWRASYNNTPSDRQSGDTERISDTDLNYLEFISLGKKRKAFKELQQRRAADKYPREHEKDCCMWGGASPTLRRCTCGLDQLPAWLRGGM